MRNTQAEATRIYKAPRTGFTVPQGGLTIHFNLPGRNVPGHADHGYGPLAAIAESIAEPGTWIPPHPHRNEEIISWVRDGVSRHDDRTVGELVIDPDHLMVMNAGSGFWHEERTLTGDPRMRMLQIFVRPHSLDLEPGIQHAVLTAPVANEWRHLVGPEGADAPFYVRNDIHLYDVRLDEGAQASLPSISGWHTYLYVFSGAVELAGTHLDEAESAVITGKGGLTVMAAARSLIVAFLIDPDATITRVGTIGR